ncbi:ankyrin, partial [Ascobolus immersus RN42]
MTLVQKLLDTGAVDVNAQDPEVSNTVLISAVRYGRVNFVKALLKAYRQKLDLNAQDVAGRTALIVAVETGDREIISILLESGSRQAISTKDELTALHIAAANADYDIVKLLLLLERGADPDLPDCNGMAPLAKAARLGHVDNVKAFLSNEHRNISPVDYQDQTPLLLAAQS